MCAHTLRPVSPDQPLSCMPGAGMQRTLGLCSAVAIGRWETAIFASEIPF